MTKSTIQAKIARAIEIKKIKATLDEEFAEIKKSLVQEADYRVNEQQRTEGGGWSWRHEDLDQNIVCITKPAPKLKSKLDPETKDFPAVKELAGRFFMNLFMQVPSYAPVEEFRVKALAHLPQATAKKLIKLVTTESPTQIAFEISNANGKESA